MKRTIWLSETTVKTPACNRYPQSLLERARQELAKEGYRFDNRNGVMRDNDSWVERYVHQSDFTPHVNEEDVMRWQFSRHINNRAFRLSHH